MQATVQWVDGVRFLAESGSGHTVTIEGPETHGGRNTGIRPMELLLLGIGGCASFDVLTILQKSRQAVTHCVARLDAERADAVPAVFTRINMHFEVTGQGLKDAAVERAVALSAEKFCSAAIMMQAAGDEMTHSFSIIEG